MNRELLAQQRVRLCVQRGALQCEYSMEEEIGFHLFNGLPISPQTFHHVIQYHSRAQHTRSPSTRSD